MASSFDRWEKDPFFSAAEEVQESADRMESTYRTWIHAVKDPSSMWNSDELRRDLRTALGTTKWQLEEFARAAGSTYVGSYEDAKERHSNFIHAIEDQIAAVEKSLQESSVSEGKASVTWVRLDEGERNELALFLSGPPPVSEDRTTESNVMDEETLTTKKADKDLATKCLNNEGQAVKWEFGVPEEDKLIPGHRRAASANADISSWKIAVAEDALGSSNGQPGPAPPRKIPSVSGFLNTIDYAAKFKWSKNGYRKLKLVDHHQEAATALGIDTCYERSKSCLDGCDECDKQLYGWYGAIQRQLQRSQYQVQYGRPIQLTFWVALLLCLIVLLALHVV